MHTIGLKSSLCRNCRQSASGCERISEKNSVEKRQAMSDFPGGAFHGRKSIVVSTIRFNAQSRRALPSCRLCCKRSPGKDPGLGDSKAKHAKKQVP
jgi:hypothetical protein